MKKFSEIFCGTITQRKIIIRERKFSPLFRIEDNFSVLQINIIDTIYQSFFK
jgi:hypothetical protein